MRAGGFRLLDELNALLCPRPIVPVSCFAFHRDHKQPFALIVSKRVRCDPGGLRKLAYRQHKRVSSLDAESSNAQDRFIDVASGTAGSQFAVDDDCVILYLAASSEDFDLVFGGHSLSLVCLRDPTVNLGACSRVKHDDGMRLLAECNRTSDIGQRVDDGTCARMVTNSALTY